MSTLTQKRLKELLEYDPYTGNFIWRVSRKGRGTGAGMEAGRLNITTGYVRVQIEGVRFMAHRIAFLYMTGNLPSDDIDHINQIKNDNRWCNLREVTRVENKRNVALQRNNKSGVHGVHQRLRDDRWCAQIKIQQETIPLGSSLDFFEAVCMRKSAEAKHGFHTNHGIVRT